MNPSELGIIRRLLYGTLPSPLKHNKAQYRKEGGIKFVKKGEGEVKECYNQGF